jgi:quinol monooxygenase YgiN
MAQVTTVAKLTAVEGKGDQLQTVIGDLVRAVQANEPGTLVYAANRETENPDVFWFFELYESTDAAAAHSTGTALAEAGGRMRGLLMERPEIHRLVPVAGKGIPL